MNALIAGRLLPYFTSLRVYLFIALALPTVGCSWIRSIVGEERPPVQTTLECQAFPKGNDAKTFCVICKKNGREIKLTRKGSFRAYTLDQKLFTKGKSDGRGIVLGKKVEASATYLLLQFGSGSKYRVRMMGVGYKHDLCK